ncbi:MAG: hypothetical protein ACMXYK_03830 [Candidatus Woesearchaeota archaeon]
MKLDGLILGGKMQEAYLQNRKNSTHFTTETEYWMRNKQSLEKELSEYEVPVEDFKEKRAVYVNEKVEDSITKLIKAVRRDIIPNCETYRNIDKLFPEEIVDFSGIERMALIDEKDQQREVSSAVRASEIEFGRTYRMVYQEKGSTTIEARQVRFKEDGIYLVGGNADGESGESMQIKPQQDNKYREFSTLQIGESETPLKIPEKDKTKIIYRNNNQTQR